MTRSAALAAATAAPAASGRAGQALAGPPGKASRPAPIPAAYRFSWRSLPRDVKFMAIGLVLVLVVGLGWLVFVPFRPKPIIPVLGWSEPTGPRKPIPTPTPRPRPAKKKRGVQP
jgi:hypothetical protein